MSFGYSFIALYLCIEKFASHHDLKASNLTGVDVGKNDISQSTKVWQSFQALGNIAFAYTFANILIEIQVHLGNGDYDLYWELYFTWALFGSWSENEGVLGLIW